MKRLILSICCLLAVFVGVSTSSVYADSVGEAVFTYSKFDGAPVSLVFHKNTGGLYLRVEKRDYGRDGDVILNFLVREAQRLCAQKGTVVELAPGYPVKFKFLGGHMVWGPSYHMGPNHAYSCFVFAYNAEMNDGVIKAWGTDEPSYWDGYAWWAGSGRGKK